MFTPNLCTGYGKSYSVKSPKVAVKPSRNEEEAKRKAKKERDIGPPVVRDVANILGAIFDGLF